VTQPDPSAPFESAVATRRGDDGTTGLVGGALAPAVGLRGTLLTVGVLGLVLSGAAVMWSPVRRHRTLPAPAAE